MDSEFDGKAFCKTVSRLPGVYVMLGHSSECLYVGKAKHLRNRLTSYFISTPQSGKIQRMLSRVASIQVHITKTESEALLLENTLIKEHRPRYNILLKDDKSYPYIRLSESHDYPGLSLYRGSLDPRDNYYGPFSSAAAVRETLSQIQKIIPVRQCQDSYFRNRSRPCLQYQIKRCSAPCVGKVDRSTYLADVADSVLLLEGKNEKLGTLLERKMEQSAESLDYESAARYRDRIAALRKVLEKQYVSGGAANADIVVAVGRSDRGCVSVMSIRNGQNLGMRHYFQKTLLDETTSEMLAAILPQYYLRNPIPKELIVHPKIDGVIELTRIFSEKAGRKVIIKSNVRDYRAQWLEMALLNTTENLDRHLASKDAYTTSQKQLSTALGLAVDPVRLECFDISHTAGEATVGACVVFDAEGPVSSQYRRFNMKSVEAGDDYGAMREVLQRRYRKVVENQEALPDLVLVDGGKGQYRIAHEVLNELLLGDIPIVAVAKGRDRKPGNEKLYISRRNSVLSLPGSSAGLHLIQQIRDEAHRFAITGHRQRRAKRRTYSTLQDVPGIGAIRRRALLKYFGGLQQLKRAPVEDLIKVAGISNSLAEKIYHFLRQD